MSHEHVEYATIARTGTVSYTGTRPSYSPDGIPVRFEVSTYDQPSEFDWSRLHPETCATCLHLDPSFPRGNPPIMYHACLVGTCAQPTDTHNDACELYEPQEAVR